MLPALNDEFCIFSIEPDGTAAGMIELAILNNSPESSSNFAHQLLL
jgi:hypothetical protein